MKALMLGAQSILLGDSGLVVAGGMESMSNVPYLVQGARTGFRMGHQQMIDGMIHDGLWDPYNNQHMGNCAELCAREKSFTRQAQDEYAAESFPPRAGGAKGGQVRRGDRARADHGRKGDVTQFDTDEGPGKAQFDKMAIAQAGFRQGRDGHGGQRVDHQ